MRATDNALGTLAQFIRFRDGCFLDNADADELREMVRILVVEADQHPEDPEGCYCPHDLPCEGLCHHPGLAARITSKEQGA